ncbi:MAG TPA: hypothetical protein ENH28_04930 [Euryarchaeota archaeon]|nr:hypothetical protein BMS3Bbin15_00664 [archaeon BMS3Bbin15]HDL15476.1 hypothetical protein [Euryarchaeota archaeon]
MKEDIIFTVNSLNYLKPDDLKVIAKSIPHKKLESLLNTLIIENKILLLKKEENRISEETFIPGPYGESEEAGILLEGKRRRDINDIYWNRLMRRVKEDIKKEIKNLKIEIIKLYDTPENLEKKYFDISIKYHNYYSFFFNINLNKSLKKKVYLEEFEGLMRNIREIRKLLDNLEY